MAEGAYARGLETRATLVCLLAVYCLGLGLPSGPALAGAPTTVGVSGGNLVIDDPASNTNQLTLKVMGSVYRVTDSTPLLAGAGATQINSLTVDVQISSVTGTIQVSTGTGNDKLTVDFSGGNIADAIFYNGGSQTSGDALALQGGGTFASVTFEYDNANDGKVTVAGNSAISYTGLEPITSTITATDVLLTYSAASESIVLANAGSGRTNVNSSAGEVTIFNNPTGSLSIKAGDGSDFINVSSLTANYPASISVDGEDGADDNVRIATGATLSFAANKNFDATAESIDVFGSLSTSGTGRIDLTSFDGLAVNSGQLATVDGGITLKANQDGNNAGDFFGITVANSATIGTIGTGNILLEGRGGDDLLEGRGGDDSGSFRMGIRVLSTSKIESTSTGAGAGSITLTGVGGAATSSNAGVIIEAGARLESVDGDVVVHGTGGTGLFSEGVRIRSGGQVTATGTAIVEVDGTGGTGEEGVELNDSAIASGSDVKVTGLGSSADGVQLVSGASITADGKVTLTATDTAASGDDIFLGTGVNVGSGDTIEIAAGDNFDDHPTSMFTATNKIAIDADKIDQDAGTGSTVNIVGTLDAPQIEINTFADGDTLNLDFGTSTGIANVSGGGSADILNVFETAATAVVILKGGAGTDTFNLGNASNSLDSILGSVTVEGEAHDPGTTTLLINGDSNILDSGDVLNFKDSGDADAATYTVVSSSVGRPGAAFMQFATIETLNLMTGAGAADVNILTTADGVNTNITSQGAIDDVDVSDTGPDSNVTIDTGAGNDFVDVFDVGVDGGDANSFGAFLFVQGGTQTTADTFGYFGPAAFASGGAPNGIILPVEEQRIEYQSFESASITGTYDFGDAPDPMFPTLTGSVGAHHGGGGSLFLGSSWDAEMEGQPSAGADGDDLDGGDDEDGVVFTTTIDLAADTVGANLDVTASGSGGLSAWIDFNADGDWDDLGEEIFTGRRMSTGTTPLSFVSSAETVPGASYARFRLTGFGATSPIGFAPDGEVEDYQVTIKPVDNLNLAIIAGPSRTFWACDTIALENGFTIPDGVEVTLHAGSAVVFQDGSAVESGGGLTVVLGSVPGCF